MGPLHGLKIVEFAALGPAPMGAMFLADMGAEVLRIERKTSTGALFNPAIDILNRNRRVVALDLKRPEGIAAALRLVAGADGLIEGLRPGVMERLGLGPEVCLSANPRLVYARMTGWGQSGPLASTAGHDINYLSLSGALHAIGEPGSKPVPPLNLVADCGGGAMLLAVGMLAGLLEAKGSGKGQVVDVAMTDGSALLMTMMYTLKAMGQWRQERGSNLLDGGAHFYDTYQCGDGKWISVGAIEPQFYALLLERTGLDDPALRTQNDQRQWPAHRDKLKTLFKTKTREEWGKIMEGSDACVAPVLDMDEAPQHPHNVARGTFITIDGVTQPAPAPRFSRTCLEEPSPPVVGGDQAAVLADWGFSADELARLSEVGAF